MDFNELRNGLLLFHRNLLEKAERTDNPRLKDAYMEAARHLKDVASSLYKFDQTMKLIKELEKQGTQHN
ncbi:hypothetical protein [Hydrogenivirga sp. 128-5-R1-1]|uniref:hypothetical protein n=1 Tax=Hydrogenivirga sp. 128-5-R1-1 TaxID=392423 RepID=UPI0012F84919|nr:hypothetical protein [Hydrogenivirga sp. 128-5-R1-1]